MWHQLFDAMGRQDALGYLRGRLAGASPPAALCAQLAEERRQVVAEAPGLEADLEAFYAAVTAEAFGWLRDGLVWPWPAATPEERRDAPRTLGILRDTTHRILGELDLKRLLPLLVQRAAAVSRAEAAFLALADPVTGQLELVESHGLPGVLPRRFDARRPEVEALLAGQAARPVAAADAPWLAPLLGNRQALVAPFWHQGELLGLLGCIGAAPGEATIDATAMLADLTGVAIRNAAYYREIHTKAAALLQANERLRDLDRMKDLFLATVSHELRTPLNFITGFGSILLDGEDVPPLLEEQRYFMEKVLEGAYQLLALVNDLLDYSRIRAGHLALQLDRLDVSHVLGEIGAGFGPLAARRGLAFHADVPADLPWVLGDRVRIEQVARNLLANALKFTPAGGRVELRAFAAEDHLRVEVRDTGIGVAPDDQHRLFQHFSQVEGALGARGGTGLGLAISRSLVEAHGGRIGLTSPLYPDRPFGSGAGSAFWFALPLGALDS
ncbi:MAG: histidine kinase [Cyanobacteria bacterium RYN_339]|nr:histidine kinase [Cyanobacteria bacterium RYN_339]